MKIIRISFSVILGAFAACCLFAVLFQGRPEHLFTAAAYVLFIYMLNKKESD